MRLRVRYSKLGKVRFTSHRDLARIWERALRRVALPVARTQGFHPRPKLHFGLALSTGHESVAEYLDIDLVEGAEVDLDGLVERLSDALPRGIDALAAAEVPAGTASLQHAVTSSRWEIVVHGADGDDLTRRITDLLGASEVVLTRERKGKPVTDDVRPHLIGLEPIASEPDGALLVAELATRDRSLRPSELVALLGDDLTAGRTRRTHQFTEHDGLRSEPLPVALDATAASAGPDGRAPHALERAS